jgi:hypothetical protein
MDYREVVVEAFLIAAEALAAQRLRGLTIVKVYRLTAIFSSVCADSE